MHCFSLQLKLCVHVVKHDLDLNQGVKSMICEDYKHEKGKCNCLCCCSIKQIGRLYCIPPVLAYRQVKKLVRKIQN